MSKDDLANGAFSLASELLTVVHDVRLSGANTFFADLHAAAVWHALASGPVGPGVVQVVRIVGESATTEALVDCIPLFTKASFYTTLGGRQGRKNCFKYFKPFLKE